MDPLKKTFWVVHGEGVTRLCADVSELLEFVADMRGSVVSVTPVEVPSGPSQDEWGVGYLKVLQDEPWAPYEDKARWVEKLFPCAKHEHDLVLDFGSGIGRLQHLLEQQGRSTYGVEVNPVAIEHASNPVVLFDGHGIPFPLDTFDLAVSMNVFEHLVADHAEHALQELLRVAPVAFISLQKALSPSEEDRKFVFDTDPTHKVAFTEEEWVELFQRHGDVESIDIGKPRVGSYIVRRRG